MTNDDFEPLQPEHHEYIATYIARLLPDAGSSSHPMQQFARHAISDALWRWTADGYNRKRRVVETNAFKYNFNHTPFTVSALNTWNANRAAGKDRVAGLRHEHSVPKKCLIEKLLTMAPEPQPIQELLSRLCKAVIVTTGDDALLTRAKLRSSMPIEWDGSDPYARYRHPRVALFDEITWPEAKRT